jgi:COP9 signalosome complex subunit 7
MRTSFLPKLQTEMNETNLSLSTSQKLLPFLLLSKSVKGVANTKLIMDALNANGVYVYTELYESPNVVEVKKYKV